MPNYTMVEIFIHVISWICLQSTILFVCAWILLLVFKKSWRLIRASQHIFRTIASDERIEFRKYSNSFGHSIRNCSPYIHCGCMFWVLKVEFWVLIGSLTLMESIFLHVICCSFSFSNLRPLVVDLLLLNECEMLIFWKTFAELLHLSVRLIGFGLGSSFGFGWMIWCSNSCSKLFQQRLINYLSNRKKAQNKHINTFQ